MPKTDREKEVDNFLRDLRAMMLDCKDWKVVVENEWFWSSSEGIKTRKPTGDRVVKIDIEGAKDD